MQKFDFIIIGSGLGGLLSGAILSKFGYTVCVLEKHSVIGGNLQTFKRKGITFSTGMHYVGSMDDGQVLKKVFDFVGITKQVEFEKLDTSCYEKVYIDNKSYCYSNGIENFKSVLSSRFPENVDEIEAYANVLKEIWDSNPIINFNPENIESIYSNRYMNLSVEDGLSYITKNEELKAVLAATNGLYAGIPTITPFYLHALINFFYIQSAYKIKDGSCSIANSLKGVIEENNGQVLSRKEAIHFTVVDNKIVSVQTKDLAIYEADNFISNIHPAETIKIVGCQHFRKAYMNRINTLSNTISSFMVYISFKKHSFKYVNHNVYYSKSNDVWAANYNQFDEFPKGYMLYTNKDALHPEYAESATIITFMKYEEVKKWEGSQLKKRGEEYEKFKEECVKKILSLVSLNYPDFECSISSYWTSSPLTNKDYTGTPDGSMYGIMKDCNNILGTYVHPKTKISNLFLVGQNTGFHGVLGVTIGALITCSFFVPLKKMLEKIR